MPLFTSDGLGFCLVILVLVLRIWSCLHFTSLMVVVSGRTVMFLTNKFCPCSQDKTSVGVNSLSLKPSVFVSGSAADANDDSNLGVITVTTVFRPAAAVASTSQ